MPTRRTWRGSGLQLAGSSPSQWLAVEQFLHSSKTPSPWRADDGRMEPTVWPCLNYRDARVAIAFLTEAFGFKEALVAPGETDDVVVHAELNWPEGGGVMLGSADRDGQRSRLPTSCASVYVVTSDPRGVHDRAVAAGARIVRELRDEGSRLDRLQRA